MTCSGGDMRKAITLMQSAHQYGVDGVTKEAVEDIASFVPESAIADLLASPRPRPLCHAPCAGCEPSCSSPAPASPDTGCVGSRASQAACGTGSYDNLQRSVKHMVAQGYPVSQVRCL